MAMQIRNLGFYEEDDDVSAQIDHHKSLRPFTPEIFSGGVANLSLLREKQFEQRDQALMLTFIVVDDDEVDTTLTLSTAVSTNSTSRNVVVENEVVDTALSLFSILSRDSIPPVYTRMPQVNEDSLTSLSLSHAPSHSRKRGAAPKRKRGDGAGMKRGRRNNKAGGEDGGHPSIEEFPDLVQALESRNGSRPVFLYGKKLEGSDVGGHHNRLFLTRREALMEFLTAEEAAAVDGRREGLIIMGLDECGKEYKLGLKKWRSLNMMVINSDWHKMVAANNAGRGDVVNIWGFRQDGKLGFAIIFRR